MLRFIKKMFISENHDAGSDRDLELHYMMKRNYFESLLGPMYDLAGHGEVPYSCGGTVDVYYFPQAENRTALATMELTEPDFEGTGRVPGSYELVAFLNEEFPADIDGCEPAFCRADRRIRNIFTSLARSSDEPVCEPGRVLELDSAEGDKKYVFLEPFGRMDGFPPVILCMEIFESEYQYAVEMGVEKLAADLKDSKVYPVSGLCRKPVE